ncbi:CoA ester lyase [Marivibrio halodurans]|uniref:CoA ester lyase n=1 Tax=Marivibrio halodurans TaxID=2039722 RepID=A0A8J7S2S5_9PROT|nr:CoA ester lyase [Marivibrio halodurans]MBP5858805.1 CoA ester lyase [Marivibrio halodurans]
MSVAVRPRRSALYMPGSNARALEKARALPADVLILDLEDAVAPDAKEDARARVLDALAGDGYGHREVLVRINGLETPWGAADLEAVARTGADGLLLPKAEGADHVRKAADLMEEAGAAERMALWCMIETPRGVLKAEEIATAHRRLGGFVMGTSDLAKDLHCLHTPDRMPFVTSLGKVVLVARAYGLAALDGVHLDLDDAEGFAAQCRQGLAFGFDGKTLIHPKTIETANAVFGPGEAEIAEAHAVIEAHESARREGTGVAVLNGKLIEALHVENARRLLDLAEMIRAMEMEAAEAEA